MKRSPVQRKTPLSAKKPIQKRRRKVKQAAQKDKRWRSEKYLSWVRAQPCVVCGSVGGNAAHHLKGVLDASGGGLKAPDSMAMAACDPHNGGWANCHAMIHSEKELRDQQPQWLAATLRKGIAEFEGETREELLHALAFLDAKGAL